MSRKSLGERAEPIKDAEKRTYAKSLDLVRTASGSEERTASMQGECRCRGLTGTDRSRVSFTKDSAVASC